MTATGPVSGSDKDAGPRVSKGTPNHDSAGRAMEATVPAKGVLAATAEAIPVVRAETGRVRGQVEAAGASAVGRELTAKFKIQNSKFKIQGGRV